MVRLIQQQKILFKSIIKTNKSHINMQSTNNQQKTHKLSDKPQSIVQNHNEELYKDQENQEILSNDSDDHQQSHTNTQNTIKESIKCITDPYEYLYYCQSNKKIKIMDQQNYIYPNVYLKDISLHYKGPMEDKMYSRNYSYYINIRRGNTLCQIYDDKQTGNKDNFELFFCRRGMKKFYDLQKQYLATGWQQKLTTQHLKYRRRIFEKIDHMNYQESKIHLYSIFKQNGQHCQITYVKKLSTWLFASKNVSILVRNQDDLEKYYEKLRFYWAKLIAKQFLKMLKQMSFQQIQELKDQLDSKTLLGQHCGYEEHQHITKYDKVQIIFYGIVQKDGEDHCLPVDYCRQFLNRFNFKMSKTKQIRNLSDKNNVYQSIYNLLKETAQGTMDQYGQGSVLYVVEEKDKIQRTISMCKLKTCQYLIFRRLRQMLKLNVERKSTANTFEKFKFDIENLINHYFKPPKSLQFYLKVGKQAFKEANKDSNVTQNYLRYKFVQFMQRVEQNNKNQIHEQNEKGKLNKKVLVVCLPRFTNKLQKYAKNNAISLQYMYRNIPSNHKKQQPTAGSIHILHMIPRLPEDALSLQNLQIFLYEYNQKDLEIIEQQLKNTKDLTKSHLITFIKSEDKKKSLELINDKIKLFEQSLNTKNIKFTTIKQQIQDKDEQVIKCLQKIRQINKKVNLELQQNNQIINKEENQNQISHKKLSILYPLLIPGSGKSTLRQQLKIQCKRNNIPFHIIDGDQIRKTLMQNNLQSKGVQLDLDTSQFNQTFGQVKKLAYQQYITKIIQKIQNHNKNSQKNQILFIDKVFGPENIQVQIQKTSIYKNVIPILLIPDSVQLKLKCFSLPFSLEYLLICLKRCLEREEHSTMTRRPEQICNTFLWYLKLYSNCNFNKLKMILQKINTHLQIIRIETVKQKKVPIHSNLKKKLQQSIDSNGNKNKMIELIQQMYKNTEDYLKDCEIQNDDIKYETAQKIITVIKKIVSNH